ncbi:MAG TPA: endonuclease VII domain-containing protein [Acidimicrobiales bacterium]|nr:endonuclease VII domain-containing protein [Acidimicrobiales bacterium]
MPTKRCKVCGIRKPVIDFYAAVGMRDGVRNDCKACNLKAKHDRYMANPEAEIARVTAWQKANPERVATNRARRRARPDVKAKEREDHLRRKYGITQADYEALLAKQDGGCAICGREPGKFSLHVDHDHKTNTIRGLLCFRCNNALGDFGDDPAQLARAVAYLTPPTAEQVRLEHLVRLRLRRELLGKQ